MTYEEQHEDACLLQIYESLAPGRGYNREQLDSMRRCRLLLTMSSANKEQDMQVRAKHHLAISLLILTLWGVPLRGAERTAADLLPESTVVYVELTQPQELVTTLLSHPLRAQFEGLDVIRSAMEKKPYLDFKAGVAFVESQMGMPWHKILQQVAGGEIIFAIDAKTQGVALLVRGMEETSQAKLMEILTKLAKNDATSKGNADPVKSGEYRGLQAFAVNNAKFVTFDRWLVVSNKDELSKQIVDRWLDSPASSFAKDAQFSAARQKLAAGNTAWAYVNTAALREAGIAKKLYKGQADNALAELLFGGILSSLQHTPYVTMSLRIAQDKLESVVSAAHDRSWAGESREYFFGPQGQGHAPATLLANEALLTVSAYRDISGMWLRAGDLFNEKTNEELAKADNVLTTLFGGKDFGEDILGTLRPEIQVIVARQSFSQNQPTPAIKLPAFALVSDLKEPEKMQPELRRTFQSLIGFLNITGAMNGQPQLELDMEKSESLQLVTSRYLPDPKAKDPLGLKINYNFSPSIAFAGKRVVIASTQELARQLAVAKASDTNSAGDNQVTNTDVALRFSSLREVLEDNHGQLVAQNMLKEGQTKEEAELAIKTLLELVGWFDRATLRMGTTDQELRLTLDVTVTGPAKK